MLATDARVTVDPNVISDARVTQFWDGEQIAGTWFAKNLEGYPGVAWDVYYLYGVDAEWADIPVPMISSGATVIGDRETLEKNILPLLAD